MPEEGPDGFDAPVTRIIQQLRGLRRTQHETFWLQGIQTVLLAIILWRVW